MVHFLRSYPQSLEDHLGSDQPAAHLVEHAVWHHCGVAHWTGGTRRPRKEGCGWLPPPVAGEGGGVTYATFLSGQEKGIEIVILGFFSLRFFSVCKPHFLCSVIDFEVRMMAAGVASVLPPARFHSAHHRTSCAPACSGLPRMFAVQAGEPYAGSRESSTIVSFAKKRVFRSFFKTLLGSRRALAVAAWISPPLPGVFAAGSLVQTPTLDFAPPRSPAGLYHHHLSFYTLF